MVLEILTHPNPILTQISRPVSELNSELRSLARNMLETMYQAKGIGLAAPQVGVLSRLIVIDISTVSYEADPKQRQEISETFIEEQIRNTFEQTSEFKDTMPMVLFNPIITKKSGKMEFDEGCLSIPDVVATIVRAKKIEFTALCLDGQHRLFRANDLLSVCVQHEIDHLDGKLFIDYLDAKNLS